MSYRTILSYSSQLALQAGEGRAGPPALSPVLWEAQALGGISGGKGHRTDVGKGRGCVEWSKALSVLFLTAVFIQTLACSLATILISNVIRIFGGVVHHLLHIY